MPYDQYGNYIPAQGTGTVGAFRGSGEGAQHFITDFLAPQEQERARRAGQSRNAYDAALNDPTGTADLFGKYFRTAAEGISAPAMRDFNSQLGAVRGNVASRFGGNASSEELRNVYNTSDLFSRNLSEALARLAPQQVQAGQSYTQMLGQRSQQDVSDYDRLNQLILQGIGMFGQGKKRGANLPGGLIGSALGAALAIPTGGMSVAAGAALGGQIGNQATR